MGNLYSFKDRLAELGNFENHDFNGCFIHRMGDRAVRSKFRSEARAFSNGSLEGFRNYKSAMRHFSRRCWAFYVGAFLMLSFFTVQTNRIPNFNISFERRCTYYNLFLYQYPLRYHRHRVLYFNVVDCTLRLRFYVSECETRWKVTTARGSNAVVWLNQVFRIERNNFTGEASFI